MANHHEETKNQLLLNVTHDCLESYSPTDNPTPQEIESHILQVQTKRINMRNTLPVVDGNGNPILDKNGVPKTTKRKDYWTIPQKLAPAQIAIIIANRHNISRIRPNMSNVNPDYDYLAMYMPDGEHKGTYVAYESQLRILAREYDFTMEDKAFKELYQALLDIAPEKIENDNPDLIAVNNGIFNYKTKTLSDFTPDIVFLSKSKVDYIPNAPNPIITMHDGLKWDVETWMSELSDDKDIVNVLWEIIGAIIRPHVKWNKSAWFYSEEGNNGKGTLCELMRNVCGQGTYVSLPLNRFSNDAMLEPLINASAIITDENDVGTYIDQAANLKAVITQDVLSINRKYKTAITFRFNGFMVQCVNEFPRIRDKSNSMHRRLLIIPFEKSFEAIERRYIKHDYLNRTEVLQYVVNKVLNTDYYELTIPNASSNILNEYKEYNDPMRQFWAEIRTELSWDLVPFNYLYDLYKAWSSKNVPEGKPVQKGKFINELLIIIKDDDMWYCEDKTKQVWAKNKMDGPQMLSLQYNLVDWTNQSSKSVSRQKRAEIDPNNLRDNYRGIQRR